MIPMTASASAGEGEANSAERKSAGTAAADANSQVLEMRARLVSLRGRLEQARIAAQQARTAREQRRAQLGKLSDGLDFDLVEVKAFKYSPSPLAKCVICCVASLLEPQPPQKGSETPRNRHKTRFADWSTAQFCLARHDFKSLLLDYDKAILQGSPEIVAAVQLRIAPEVPSTKVPETVVAQTPRHRSSVRDLIRPDGIPVRPLTAADVGTSSRPVQQLHRWCSRVLAQLDEQHPLPEEDVEQALEAAVEQAEENQVKAVDLATLEAERELASAKDREFHTRAAATAPSPMGREDDDSLSPRARRLAEAQSRARSKAVAAPAVAAAAAGGPGESTL